MKFTKRISISACLLASIGLSSAANAALLGRVNAFYDGAGGTQDSTYGGVVEKFGDSVQLINTPHTGKSAVAYKAYQYNLILTDKAHDKANSNVHDDVTAADVEAANSSAKIALLPTAKQEEAKVVLDNRIKVLRNRSIPMYIFLKQSTDLTPDLTSMTNDLLDPENGGVVNIKLSGGENLFGKNHGIFAQNSDFKNYGAKVIYDGGIKLFGAPSATPASTTSKNSSFTTSGYLGGGLSFEFPIGDAHPKADAKPGDRPAGSVAIGFGVYRNWAGPIDSTLYATPVRQFSTRVLMYEMIITDNVAVRGTRVIPTAANSPLNSYTGYSVAFKF